MKKILITGGPVHAYLDDVKIVTNRFKGGLMCQLVSDLFTASTSSEETIEAEITYLCSKASEQPSDLAPGLTVVHHDGFDDYQTKVIELSKTHEAVILGAAVANLIPKNRIHGKFPSHNYKVGDTIPIEFTIAPRVIEEVKQANPSAHLFGFKLLSGTTHEELIRAAYDTCLHSRATAVFANEARSLNQKYVVTKERSVIPLPREDMAAFIWQAVQDTYYQTEVLNAKFIVSQLEVFEALKTLIKLNTHRFTTTPEGFVFGTAAVRDSWGGFVTTGRGKKELESFSWVHAVMHNQHKICAVGGKASLNAPLLDTLFKNNKDVYAILHFHAPEAGLPEEVYAFPGTVRDSIRKNTSSFNIRHHGCFLLLDKNLNQI